MSTLKGKSAIVTGSTSGIGLGIARRFAAQGADITLNGFGDRAEIDRLQGALAEEFGVRVIYSDADISIPEAVRGMVAKATEGFGKVDVLVNNAGIQYTAPVQDFPDEKWHQILAINLSGVFFGMKAVLPQMLERNWGRIINISSVHGMIASLNKAAYVAAKHGVLGLTRVAALETAKTGVTVNSICPGWVLTPLVLKQIEDRAAAEGKSVEQAKVELLSEKQPSQQFVTPEQVGDLAVFLASPAADQLTGQAIAMDGGWTAQ